MDADGRRRQALEPGSRRRAETRPRLRDGLLRLSPVVELGPPAARRQPAHVGPLAVRALELLVRVVAVLVPVLRLLGDPEVDEGAVPELGETHDRPMLTRPCDLVLRLNRPRGRFPAGRRWRPPRPRPDSPGRSPSTARPGRA